MQNPTQNKLSHKGYTGSTEVSIEDLCLHGRILFIDDIITYEGSTVEELILSFKDAVDNYLIYCKKTGKPANKPYSGTFNVRTGPELHRKAAQDANSRNMSLNDYVSQAIKMATEYNGVMKVEHTHRHCFVVDNNKIPETKVVTTNNLSKWEPIGATLQ